MSVPSCGRSWLFALGLWLFASAMLIAITFGSVVGVLTWLFLLPGRLLGRMR